MNSFAVKLRKCLRRPAKFGPVFGLMWITGFAGLGALDRPAVNPADERAVKLEAFFRTHGCPQPYHVGDYLVAADLNGIDYRLLPAVSVRESTCGLHARLNNRWGWDSARTGFESVARGIHFIAYELAFGRYYRGKTLEQKLHEYNPNPKYVHEVKRLMFEIDGD